MEIQFATTLYIIIMSIALFFTVLKMLQHNNTEAKTIKMAFIIFGSWFVATLLLFGENTVLPKDISSFGLFSIVLLGLGVAGLALSPLFKALIALPQEFLLLPQAFRMFFGAGFIVEAVFGIIPAGYGAVDGIFYSIFGDNLGYLCSTRGKCNQIINFSEPFWSARYCSGCLWNRFLYFK